MMNNKLSTENSKCNQTIRLINQIKALSDKTKNISVNVIIFVIMLGKCICCNNSDIQCQRKICLSGFSNNSHI